MNIERLEQMTKREAKKHDKFHQLDKTEQKMLVRMLASGFQISMEESVKEAIENWDASPRWNSEFDLGFNDN